MKQERINWKHCCVVGALAKWGLLLTDVEELSRGGLDSKLRQEKF